MAPMSQLAITPGWHSPSISDSVFLAFFFQVVPSPESFFWRRPYSWYYLLTRQNHLNHAFLHFSVTFSTIIVSLIVSLCARMSIIISVTSSFFTREIVIGTVPNPYSLAGWTIILWISVAYSRRKTSAHSPSKEQEPCFPKIEVLAKKTHMSWWFHAIVETH